MSPQDTATERLSSPLLAPAAALTNALAAHSDVTMERQGKNAAGVIIYERVCACGVVLPWETQLGSAEHNQHVVEALCTSDLFVDAASLADDVALVEATARALHPLAWSGRWITNLDQETAKAQARSTALVALRAVAAALAAGDQS